MRVLAVRGTTFCESLLIALGVVVKYSFLVSPKSALGLIPLALGLAGETVWLNLLWGDGAIFSLAEIVLGVEIPAVCPTEILEFSC